MCVNLYNSTGASVYVCMLRKLEPSKYNGRCKEMEYKEGFKHFKQPQPMSCMH